jgi:solute carrier family 25 aspartate/glutamate transporter 12/13
MSQTDLCVDGIRRKFKALISNPIKRVQCDSPSKTWSIKRADPETLQEVFLKYASIEKNGEHFMSDTDFIRRFLGLMNEDNYNCSTVKLLANVVDTTKDGLISFVEFEAFEALLCSPDSVYVMAFQIFDTNSSGYVTYDEFEDVLKRTELHQHIPFDFNSKFILLHFGKNKQRTVSYTEFTQLLHDFYEEHALQAFTRFDKDCEGFITALEFHDIMTTLKSHLLTKFVRQNLLSVAGGGHGAKKVSYSYFIAFISLLNSMELVKQIYHSATGGNQTKELTREELLHEAQKYTQITPMEIDILFQLLSAKRQDGRITYIDLQSMAPLDIYKMPYSIQAQALQEKIQEQYAGHGRGVLIQIFENVYRFGLGSVAGAIGATTVYPIDLVKTRMQNQRIGSHVGEVMYKNSVDCFKKVIRHEGVKGLYRGLAPQLVGVAPEKAIKLTVNFAS